MTRRGQGGFLEGMTFELRPEAISSVSVGEGGEARTTALMQECSGGDPGRQRLGCAGPAGLFPSAKEYGFYPGH